MTELQKDLQIKAAKRKALDSTFSQIDKHYGKGSIMFLGDSPCVDADVISSGSFEVDTALGIGGFARGKIVEIYGPEASGKTTLALQVIAQAQKTGGICAFIDAEHALDPVYASKLGIQVGELVIAQPDYGEQALDIAEMLIRSNALDVIVVDSVAALVPKNELDGDMGDTHVGLQARLMSQALRKLTPIVNKSKTLLIFINQVRQNISALAFGPKETTTGGNALKFYSSVRLDVRRIESLKDKEGVQYGNRVNIKVVKNKMAPPFRVAQVCILFGEGISRDLEIFDASLREGLIVQSGSWFSKGSEKLGQGRDSVLSLFKTNPALRDELEQALRARIKAARAEKEPAHTVTAEEEDSE